MSGVSRLLSAHLDSTVARLASHRWQEVHVRGDDDPLGRPPIREHPMAGRAPARLVRRRPLPCRTSSSPATAQVRDGSAFGRGGVQAARAGDRRPLPRSARRPGRPPWSMIGHAAASRRDVSTRRCRALVPDPGRGEDGGAASAPRRRSHGRPARASPGRRGRNQGVVAGLRSVALMNRRADLRHSALRLFSS